MAEVGTDVTFFHQSSDQDCLKIAPNDADGLVTSRRYGRTLYTICGIETWVVISISYPFPLIAERTRTDVDPMLI